MNWQSQRNRAFPNWIQLGCIHVTGSKIFMRCRHIRDSCHSTRSAFCSLESAFLSIFHISSNCLLNWAGVLDGVSKSLDDVPCKPHDHCRRLVFLSITAHFTAVFGSSAIFETALTSCGPSRFQVTRCRLHLNRVWHVEGLNLEHAASWART